MQENSLIKQNILKYLDLKGITPYRFYKENDVTRGILTQNNGITEENLLKFVRFAQDISLEWLLTGEGAMLKSEDISSTDKQPHKTQSTSSDDGYFDRLLHRIEELSAENAILKADLERIRSSVDNVDSDTSALAV